MTKIKLLTKFLPFILLFAILFGLTVRADTISDLQNQQKTVEQSIQDVKNQKDDAAAQIASIEQEIETMDGQMTDCQNQIDDISAQLDDTNQQLTQTQDDLAHAETDRDAQYEMFKQRLVFMYENGDTGYLSVLFQATDFTDFLNRAEYINRIAQNDKNMLDKLQSAEDLVSQKLDQVTATKTQLEALQTEQLAKQADLQSTIDQKQEYLDGLDNDQSTYDAKIQWMQQQDAQLAAQIKKAQDDAALQAKAAAAAKASKQPAYSGGGSMTWPVPGHYYISSPFGYRVNPLSGKNELHTGIDIPAPTGTTIVAARGGVVIYARWMSGYGNTIEIDCGGGVVCLYGHSSKLLVSEGQTVSEGQAIAKAGSTGNSTGPHCHFQVMVNGTAVNPNKYLNF
ncbi:MAG: peptidoglycan DD-metalloendopeptidase family protein [Defluviitaleaceae bacterium]|nr:peptidoglycan DD-metalloendopeptidase family protein [Defluviitaleaceae bacterium]